MILLGGSGEQLGLIYVNISVNKEILPLKCILLQQKYMTTMEWAGIEPWLLTVHQERHAGVLTTTPAAHTISVVRSSLSILHVSRV